ncbi:MAG TPA: hypothetical protein VMZ00_11345 [Sporichthya sp.]|nr:hypothetical protein [Sporichthya sp.]
MTQQQDPVDEVVNCDVHEAYSVQFHALEDVDWSQGAPDADTALAALVGSGEAEVISLLKFEPRSSFSDQVTYAGLFGDGSVHGAVTISQQPQGEAWSVTHAVVCTLEEVPEEEIEEEDSEFGYLEDDDIFEE